MGRIKLIYRLALTLVFIITVNSEILAGGGWPQPKGFGFFKLGQYMIISDKYYTPGGDIADITTTGYYATSLYAEYGITDRLTVISYIPFFVRSTLNRVEKEDGTLVEEGDELNSFGDTDITIKYGILTEGPVVVSTGLTLGLPLGVYSGGRTELLQTGDGEFNQMVTVEASSSSANGRFYGTLLGGINFRSNNFSEELRYGLELGYKIKDFWLINRIYGIKSFYNGDDSQVANNGIFNNDMEYLSISPEIIYEIKDKFGFTASAGFAPYGKKVLARPSYSAGLFFKLKN